MRKLLSPLLIIISVILPVLAIISLRNHVLEQNINWSHLAQNAYELWPLLLLVVLMMPINWAIEITKWKSLRNTNFKSATREVLSGLGLAFFTPNRIGEAGGRLIGVPEGKRWQAGASFVYSSLAQSLCTLWAGIAGFCFFQPFKITFLSQNILFIALILSIILGLLLYFNLQKLIGFIPFGRKWKAKLDQVSEIPNAILLKVLLLSISRYLIFSFQFALLIQWLDPTAAFFHVLAGIAITYLLCALVPGSALAELGIRESAGVLIIGLIANPIAVVSATFILWLINLAGPSLIGTRILGRNINALKPSTV